jgi:lipoprotein-anchoring transpeptidase ErfK/SrfK
MAVIAMMAVIEVSAQESPVARRLVVVSIPDRKLALVEDGRVVKVYPTAVGAPGSPSPIGAFTIINRVQHPTWYGPRKPVPPGKANPLGTRWLGLSLKGYGIHGTNAPHSIGRAASHGCIRMLNQDVEELFELVSEGDAVKFHGERDEQVVQIFGFPEAPSEERMPAVESTDAGA